MLETQHMSGPDRNRYDAELNAPPEEVDPDAARAARGTANMQAMAILAANTPGTG